MSKKWQRYNYSIRKKLNAMDEFRISELVRTAKYFFFRKFPLKKYKS